MNETMPGTAVSYPLFPELLPETTFVEGKYEVRFARGVEELDAVQKLRFEVFNLELGEGLEESYDSHRDRDEFDPVCHHLIVVHRDSGEIVGTYRLQTSAMARAGQGFYSRTLFTLDLLPAVTLDDAVELGRACVALEHRNTQVLFLLWRGLALYVGTNQKRFLFGCCSLTSQDPVEGKTVMDHLEKNGHVHPEFRVDPQPGFECYDDSVVGDASAKVVLPKLFRIYLRHGAKVCGPPAIDREFKTIDYLVIFDVASMTERQVRTFFS